MTKNWLERFSMIIFPGVAAFCFLRHSCIFTLQQELSAFLGAGSVGVPASRKTAVTDTARRLRNIQDLFCIPVGLNGETKVIPEMLQQT